MDQLNLKVNNNYLRIQHLINSLVTIAALCCIVFAIQNSSTLLLVLPITFVLLYIFFFYLLKLQQNWCTILIIVISFIRFSLLPVMYSENLESSYVPYLTYDFSHLDRVIVILITEEFAIFFGMFWAFKSEGNRQREIDNTDTKSKIKAAGIATLACIILGAVVLVSNPQLIRGINEVADKDRVSGSIETIFQVVIIVTSVFLLDRLERSSMRRTFRLISSILIFIILIYLSSNMATSTSRNSMMINTIILLFYLTYNYRNALKYIFPLILVGSILLFSVVSYKRFPSYQVSDNQIYAVFQSMFQYQVLNAYFAGPTNIDVGITMIEQFQNQLGLILMIPDFFANVPFLHKLFSRLNSVTLFNLTMSEGTSNDQIVPLIVQSSAYFGFLFAPLLSFISTFFSLKAFLKLQLIDNSLLFYCISYIIVVLAMAPMLNINIISMLIMIRVAPVLLIGGLNKLFILNRIDTDFYSKLIK